MTDQTPSPKPTDSSKKSLQEQGTDLWSKIELVIAGILVGLFVIIIFQNWEDVQVDGLFWNFEVPLSLVMLVSFLLGILVTAVYWAKRRLFGRD